jgi:diaminopimelate decarboxylase
MKPNPDLIMQPSLSNDLLLSAASQFGTPLYVYHAEKIDEQYKKLTTAFAEIDARFFYACKALTNINVLSYIRTMGSGVDCSSNNEVHLALKAGFAPENILYTSNGISFSEIEEVARLGVHVNIDSLSNLEKFAQTFGYTAPVGIRLRPNIMAGGNLKISTGHDKSKFGIPVEQIEEIVCIQKKYNLRVKTLHIHTGSDIKDASVFTQGLEVLFKCVHHFPDLEVLDLGGGFKVPYHPSEKETDLKTIAAEIKNVMTRFRNETNRNFQLWFEPGKFIVSHCGVLLTRVNVLKNNGNILIAGVDTGLNHLIRPMIYDAYHHILNLSNPTGDIKNYMVTGYICETDTFAEDRPLPEIREDDILCILNAGAYGFEMSSHYNSRFKPAELLVEKDKIKLIRRRDTLDDLLSTQL